MNLRYLSFNCLSITSQTLQFAKFIYDEFVSTLYPLEVHIPSLQVFVWYSAKQELRWELSCGSVKGVSEQDTAVRSAMNRIGNYTINNIASENKKRKF